METGDEGLGAGDLGAADEEGDTGGGGEEGGGGGEDGVEAFDGAQGEEAGGGRGKVLGAAGEYIDIRQCKSADDFAQEGHFLMVGLDQCDSGPGRPDLHGEAGESGSGTQVY